MSTLQVQHLPRPDRLSVDYDRDDRATLREDIYAVILRATGKTCDNLEMLNPLIKSSMLNIDAVGYRLLGKTRKGLQAIEVHLMGFCCELFMALEDLGLLRDELLRQDVASYMYSRGNAVLYFSYEQ